MPESFGRAFRIKRFDVVVSSLRVITVIPPRSDSYEIICMGLRVCATRICTGLNAIPMKSKMFLLGKKECSDGKFIQISMVLNSKIIMPTILLCVQIINAGGSGDSRMEHVKFIVEPLSMYNSDGPSTSVIDSVM